MENKIKSFVIDTNVLIHRPDAILSFRDNEVVIPLWVLEELDNLKSAGGEKGRNARGAIRFLDEHSRKGSLQEGVLMENGSLLKVALTYDRDSGPFRLDEHKMDNKILLVAHTLQKQGKRVFFVSKDINARVKATALGLKAMDYEKQKVDYSNLYSGVLEVDISPEAAKEFKENGSMEWGSNLLANQFLLLKIKGTDDKMIGRFDCESGRVKYVPNSRKSIWGIKPINSKQVMAMNLLMDDSISLVSLVGIAGTGKTLLSVAVGLKKCYDDAIFTKVLVSRPIIPMGKDIGFLPGTKEVKMQSWMQPLFDNMEYILGSYKNTPFETVPEMLTDNFIEIEALTYIRGRSLPQQFIIIDEAQNLSPHEVKTIVSRAGKGTKVVLTGDPEQIDSPYLDSNSNGLSFMVEAFKGQSIFGHVTLEKSERSKLAELAAELL